MPFVRLSALEDELNVFWRSNLPGDIINDIASTTRPILVILNFTSLSIDFLDKQFEDPAFLDHNLFAFDLPGYGKTKCPLLSTPKQLPLMDEWVMAA
jgi:predicted membrane chloride channel (bestrophin family)